MKLLSKLMMVFTVVASVILTSCVAFAAPAINPGTGFFMMDEPAGANQDQMKVYYNRPETWKPGDAIVVVFHGIKRNADQYMEQWVSLSNDNNLLVVCPEYTEAKFPGVKSYNFGFVSDTDDEKGAIQPEDKWTFRVVDDVIVNTKKAADAENSKVVLFGHSAGSQLMHRYVFFNKKTEADLIIAANAGWYTMPNYEDVFPYGFKNTPATDENLVKAFAMPVVVLVGEEDTKRAKVLRVTPWTEAQGKNRFERAFSFFEQAQAQAKRLNTEFNWVFDTVPGVGHNQLGMAKFALPIINAIK